MGKISTAEVLRLRAPSAVSRDKAVRRSAQDDDLVGVLKKNIRDRSVTRSAQDDDFVGGLKKNIPNKLARMGRSLGLSSTKFSSPSGTDLWFSVFRNRIVTRSLAKVAPEAARVVIVHHSRGLHPGVDDDWADEFEASLFERQRDLL
jgi:hypothetical protein